MEYGQTIYNYAFHKVCNGADFKIDLKTHTVVVDGEVLIDGGKYDGELGLQKYEAPEEYVQRWALNDIEIEYGLYWCSMPTKKSMEKRHNQFVAMSLDEVMKRGAESSFAQNRDWCQFALEFKVLFHIITGQLKWLDEWTEQGMTYYWKPNNPDNQLRLQREWFW